MTSDQSKKIADRLDGLVSTLASSRAPLDDLTRARVAAKLQASLHAPVATRVRTVRRRWAIAAAAAGVIAVIGAGWRMRGPAVAIAPVVAPVVAISAPDGELILTRQAGVSRGEVDGASLTLYGEGHATRHGRRVAIDAEAVVVDRSAAPADAPALELTVRAVSVRVQHATFSVDSSPARVTVIRGELILQCPGEAGEQTVRAGGSVTCGSEVRRAPTVPTVVASPPAVVASPSAVVASPPAVVASPSAVVALPPAVAAQPSPSLPPPIAALLPPSSSLSHAIAHAPEKRAPSPERADPADDLAARYAAAEQLMTRDPRAARAALRALIDAAPTGEYAAPALLDLARLAHAAGDAPAARAALDELAIQPRAAALAMPAAYLRCKLTPTDVDHRRCLAAFRIAFPRSPRDAEALAELAASVATAGDCAAALPLVDEYLRTYPSGASRDAMHAWRARCAPTSP